MRRNKDDVDYAITTEGMDSPPAVTITPQTSPPWGYFFIVTLIAVGIFVWIEYSANLGDIANNWSEYRCQPVFMPLAGVFGYDINENFQFCLQKIIQEQAKGVTGPFATGMAGFASTLMTLMNSANSFRVMLATLVGGVIKIVQEFRARITAVATRIRITAGRMKALMYRIYGTMFAIIFLGMSAQTALFNFGDSFVFKFIDAFCFPPEQQIELYDGSIKAIRDVKINDVLAGGSVVQSTYTFYSDGQDMVSIGDVTVSSNHFISHDGRWIMAKDHPLSIDLGPWNGGIDRPLYCLTTHNHKLPIGGFIFADYDETELGNASTQRWVDGSLNGIARPPTPHPDCSYEIGSPETTRVKTPDGWKELRDFKLGDRISKTKQVVGIQVSEITDFCILKDGTKVGSGSLVWSSEKEKWVRAYSIYETVQLPPTIVIALFVSPGALYELEGGHIVRDAMEIYSPDTKKAYADVLLKKGPESS